MVALSQNVEKMTEEQYFAFCDDSEIKYEFVGGTLIAMAGVSVRHGIIKNNVSAGLHTQLRDSHCFVIDDVRLAVESKKVSYRFPDVMVLCGEANTVKDRTDTIDNPTVLVEVLSESTEKIDTRDKLAEYTQLASVQEYILVSQDKPQIERFKRQTNGDWLYTRLSNMDDVLHIESIKAELTMQSVYARINFTDDDEQASEG